MAEEDWEEKTIALKEEGKTLFCGVATGIGIICENGVYYLEAEAVSWTIKLDCQRKKRSFQEKWNAMHRKRKLKTCFYNTGKQTGSF